jgi:hypothetical protein
MRPAVRWSSSPGTRKHRNVRCSLADANQGNAEGTENGGLIFGGERGPGGIKESNAHL